MQVITEQTCDEHLHLLHSKEDGRDVCHYILVPYDKMSIIKKYDKGENVSIRNCYRIIEYRDERGKVRRASFYGRQPPENLSIWINNQYGPAAIDKNTPLIYVEDDIRLCTIQRSNLDQLIGLSYRFHNCELFYYVESLTDESKSKLALCAGVKVYDRIIECNGVNIEGDSEEDLLIRIEKLNILTIQLLVCSPATYVYYKSKNKQIHSNLRTVKQMKPVNDKSAAAALAGTEQIRNGDYCAVRWEDNSGVSIVQQSVVRKPPDTIQLFEQRVIERDGRYRNGQIILKGIEENAKYIRFKSSKSDCEVLRYTNQTVNSNAYASVPREDDYKPKSNINPRSDYATRETRSDVKTIVDNENTHHVPCDGCQSHHIQDDRYRCLECFDFDLCGECFEKRFEKDQHRSGHIYVHFKTPNELFNESILNINQEVSLSRMKKRFVSVEHTGINCDGCQTNPIVGIRLKCDACLNYDLCLTCVEQKVITLQHQVNHPLIIVEKNCLRQIDMNDIKLGERLGRGAFGTVYKAEWRSKNRQVACKIFTESNDRKDLIGSFQRELNAYNELSGAYILKLYGYALEQPKDRDDDPKFALIMEYMGQGSLTDVIKKKKISLHQKLEISWHIASGMKKLHARQMIHRDIRPDNILVNDFYTAKIGDMGIARLVTTLENQNLTMIGAQLYMPPEFYTGKYNQSLDVYTFGLTLYHIFTGYQHSFDALFRRVVLSRESPVFHELIVCCIDNKPKRRPSAVEIEVRFNLYRRAFGKFIRSEHPKYEEYPIDYKDQVFMKFYNTFHPQVTETLTNPSTTYSSEEDMENIDQNLIVLMQWLMQVMEQQ